MREFAELGRLIIGLGGQVNELSGRVDELSGQVNALNGRVDALDGRMDALIVETNSRFDEMNDRMDALNRRIDGTNRRFTDLHDDIGDMKGAALEWRLRETGIVAIADDLGFRSAEPVRFAEWGQASSEFNEMLRQAQDAGAITSFDYRRILKTDAIFRGRNPSVPAENSPYVLVEASHHARENKINQALLSRIALKKMLPPDFPVYSALYCARIPEEIRDMARGNQISVHMSDREL